MRRGVGPHVRGKDSRVGPTVLNNQQKFSSALATTLEHRPARRSL